MFDFGKLKFWDRHKCYYCGCPEVRYYKKSKADKGKSKTDYYCNLCYNLRYLQGR